MENRQYVAVRFKPDAKRTYTYHHDGSPVAPGDRVNVDSFDGEGWQTVTVDHVTSQRPSFPTKSIKSVVGDGKTQPVGGLFKGEA